MPNDLPITRETVGQYRNLGAEYTTLPGRQAQQLGSAAFELDNQISEQSNKLYLLQASNTLKQNLSRIEEENMGNPEAMQASFESFRKGYIPKINGADNQALMDAQFTGEIDTYLRKAKSTQRERLDTDSSTNGLMAVNMAKKNMATNLTGLFSKDPADVLAAGNNLKVQAKIITDTSKLTKADGSPMYTPQQQAAMLEIPDASISDAAKLAWSQIPDAEKLSIIETAQKGSTGLPADMGADTVKPYTPDQIKSVQALAAKPSPYDALFQKYAAQEGVDWKELKLRSAVESSLNPNAVGPKTKYGQSVGLMQLTEETAKGLGVTDRTDPEQSIAGAAKLLKQHQDEAGGNKSVVDKLYYGGPDQKNWGKNTEQYAENFRALRGGAGMAGETGTAFDYLPTAEKAKAFEEAGDLSTINAMKFAPLAERQKLAQSSGSSKVLSAYNAIDTALRTDPAAYVATAPDVQVQAAQYLQAPTPATFKSYVDATLNQQTKMGVPAYAQKIMPKNQAEGIVQEVTNSFTNGAEAYEKMQGLQAQYGEYWPRVFQELTAAKLPASAYVLGSMDRPAQKPYGRLLATGVGEGAENVMKSIGDDNKKAINQSVTDELQDFRVSTERVQGGVETINAVTESTKLLAAKLIQTQGLSATQAVRTAASAITNDYYEYNGTYKIPREVDTSKVRRGADLRLDNFWQDFQPPAGGDYKDKEGFQAYNAAVRAHGYWVNTPEGDGLALKDGAGNYVRFKDGGFVRYNYDELTKYYNSSQKKITDKEMQEMLMKGPML